MNELKSQIAKVRGALETSRRRIEAARDVLNNDGSYRAADINLDGALFHRDEALTHLTTIEQTLTQERPAGKELREAIEACAKEAGICEDNGCRANISLEHLEILLTHATAQEWRETVRTIYDELHFGTHTVFEDYCAKRIVQIIEDRHRDYFCMPTPPTATHDTEE